MVIAHATDTETGEKIILFGLSFKNLDRLRNGEPIKINRETHGEAVPEGVRYDIIGIPSEQALYDMMKESGSIGPDTVVHKDPRFDT